MTAPGPPGRFLVGNLPEFARDILGFMERCAREYGDVKRVVPFPSITLRPSPGVHVTLAAR